MSEAKYYGVSGTGEYLRYFDDTLCSISREFISCDDQPPCYEGHVYTYTDCK